MSDISGRVTIVTRASGVFINPDGSVTDRSEKVIAKTPMRQFGNISELNGVVQFLCSDAQVL